jgi:sugar phosphate isomerase/epimerase
VTLGIFARTFPRPSLAETLDAVAATGLRVMQFNPALMDAGSSPEDVRAAAAERGLATAAVSGTFNMAHPDASARADGARRLAAVIEAAPALGTRIVTLCTGTRDAEDMWRRHPDNDTPEAWHDMRASVEAAVARAEAHGVTLAFEPEHGNVVRSAAAGRRLLDEIRSPHLRVVLDPANLVDDLDRQGDVLREAFDLLGDDVVLAHAKDVRRDGTLVAAGRGELDYPLYLSLLRPAGVPLILHGLAEDEVAGSITSLRAPCGGS